MAGISLSKNVSYDIAIGNRVDIGPSEAAEAPERSGARPNENTRRISATWRAPGVRVAWKSSLDDVAIEVRFDKSNNGTLVRVEATLPEGGADKGGTAWLRMTPLWFGSWIRKRDRVPHEPLRLARLAVAVHYAKPATAARWLQDVFGFEPSGNIPDDDAAGDHTWIEFQVGNAPLILFQRDGEPPTDGPVTHAPWVFVDNLDAHHARAKRRGATVEDIVQHGFRGYTATDLEGNRWTFAQASPRQL